MSNIKIGCHVSIAGGIWKAPLNAADLGCETFQIFTRSPQGGPAAVITEEAADMFKQNMKDNGMTDFVVHAPYFINFGSINPKIYHGSTSIVRGELERGSQVGAKYLMFHSGSIKDHKDKKDGLDKAKIAIKKVLEGYEGSTQLLLENAAGVGEILGDTFEELAELMEPLLKYKTFGGFCYDTQHAFASGYDIRTPEAVTETFKQFDKIIGLKYLKMFQVNDSKPEFNSHKDRHEHIGDGNIGKKGFASLVEFLQKKKWSGMLILETEHDKVESDLKTLKHLRDKN